MDPPMADPCMSRRPASSTSHPPMPCQRRAMGGSTTRVGAGAGVTLSMAGIAAGAEAGGPRCTAPQVPGYRALAAELFSSGPADFQDSLTAIQKYSFTLRCVALISAVMVMPLGKFCRNVALLEVHLGLAVWLAGRHWRWTGRCTCFAFFSGQIDLWPASNMHQLLLIK